MGYMNFQTTIKWKYPQMWQLKHCIFKNIYKQKEKGGPPDPILSVEKILNTYQWRK